MLLAFSEQNSIISIPSDARWAMLFVAVGDFFEFLRTPKIKKRNRFNRFRFFILIYK